MMRASTQRPGGRGAPAAELGDSDAAAGAERASPPCASSCASLREPASRVVRQNNLARRQTSPPLLVTTPPAARMTQVLVSLNTLGLEMNRQVMTVTIDFISGPLSRLSRIMDAKSLQVWILSLRLTFMRAS